MVRATRYTPTGIICDPIGSVDDPNCQDRLEGCDPRDPNCNDPAYLVDSFGDYCIPVGKKMPSGFENDPDFIPPCNPSAEYCPFNGRALLRQDCK